MREILEEQLGLPIAETARRMEMSRKTRSSVLGGKRTLITGIARRFEQVVKGNTEFYLDMQTALDMWRTRQRLKDQLAKIEPIASGGHRHVR